MLNDLISKLAQQIKLQLAVILALCKRIKAPKSFSPNKTKRILLIISS